MEQVVVSAGEPVAWAIETDGETGRATFETEAAVRSEIEWRRDEEAATLSEIKWKWGEEDRRERRAVPLFPSAPVVLPETPPADLIELIWLELPGEAAFRKEAAEIYAVLRAWVAGGGETR